MNFNRKHIGFGLALLVLCWIGNIVYYQNHIIKEPLFIKHYYDVPQGMNNFQLYYIENLSSQNKITSIIFPEIGQQHINFTEANGNTDNRYYMLKNIMVSIINTNQNTIPHEYKNKIITKALIEFSDGKTLNVNLGKIYLYSDEMTDRALESYSASSSNNNTGSSNFTANKDIKITGINSRFDGEIKNILQISINEESLSKVSFPIILKKGDMLSINYRFSFNENDLNRNNAYDFHFNILTEDLNGNKGSTHCYVNTRLQSPEYFDIDELKNDRNGQ